MYPNRGKWHQKVDDAASEVRCETHRVGTRRYVLRVGGGALELLVAGSGNEFKELAFCAKLS
jgi:hypothetical protein